MPDDITKTETIVREYDKNGDLVQEVSTVITTRKPQEAVKAPFGIRAKES